MATSKLPSQFTKLSDGLPETLSGIRGVFVNWIPPEGPWPDTQTGEKGTREVWGDGIFVSYGVYWFLKGLATRLPVKVLLLFKGYGKEPIGVAVVEVTNIYWTSDDYPRLDFEHLLAFSEINGCPNFWGAFILAIAKVSPETRIFAAEEDLTCDKFIELARELAVP